MTDVLTGTVLQLGEWTPEQAAEHVVEAWQDAVESIIETGRRLIEAKQKVGHGNWLPTVELLPFGESAALKLMQIARHKDLANPDFSTDLPASWTTLAALAELPLGEIPKRIEAGEVTPELRGATARGWAATYNVAKQEALNAWSGAVDGLTSALSYAKTWTPPADIPASHVAVGEFIERLTTLLEIAKNWSTE